MISFGMRAEGIADFYGQRWGEAGKNSQENERGEVNAFPPSLELSHIILSQRNRLPNSVKKSAQREPRLQF